MGYSVIWTLPNVGYSFSPVLAALSLRMLTWPSSDSSCFAAVETAATLRREALEAAQAR